MTNIISLVFRARTPAFAYLARCVDSCGYYAAKKINDLFRRIGVNRWFTYLPLASKVLVKIQNSPNDSLKGKSALQQIDEKAREILKDHQIPEYVNFHFEPQQSLETGVCQGMVQVFIQDFYQASTQGFPFQQAAIKAAEQFKKGASLFTCAMQYLHQHGNSIDTPAFNKYVSEFNDSQKIMLHCMAKGFFGHLILGGKVSVSLEKDLETLPDGIYDVTLGWRLENGKLHKSDKNGHATAFLIHEKSFLIFDPFEGLFSHPEPNKYFKRFFKDDYDILGLTLVKK